MDRETILEKYVQGLLTAQEQIEFDLLIKEDPKFKTEVKFHENLKKVTEAEHDADFRQLLSDFESEYRAKNSSVRRAPVKWLVAASIVLLVGLSYFFIINQNISSQELFAKNFEPYPNVVHPIVRSENGQDPRTEAFTAYQAGNFETSIELFSALQNSTEEPHYLFYKANALIASNRAAEAIPLLKAYLTSNDDLADKTNWYLAMAYLQMDDKEQAVKTLEKIVESGNYKVKESGKLLRSLK